MSFSLTWLPTVLKNAGLKVAEEPGWKNRGTRNIGTIKGVMCHHTASKNKRDNMPSLRVVRDGTSTLSGPLSQLCLGRDGTFFVVAAGRANHAGRGKWQGETGGNSHFIGIEAENTGRNSGPLDDFPWPTVQMDAYRRGCAAILKHIGQQNAFMCCGHKEFRRGKIDPLFDMDTFRLDVTAIMNGTVPVIIKIPPKDSNNRPTLRRGANSDLVKEIQAKVGVNVDGDFGPKTEAAVREFQRTRGLVPDGIVGPRTWAALGVSPSSN